MSALDGMTPQSCERGVHADFAVDSEHAHTCPWCEIDRLRGEHEADRRTWQSDLAKLREARAERDGLKQRLHGAAMTRTWTNEDGKKFVFAEDIAPHLLGPTKGGAA